MFAITAFSTARENQVDREVNQAALSIAHLGKQVFDASHIHAPRHGRIEFAGFQRATSFTIEHGGKAVAAEQGGQLAPVGHITCHNTAAVQTPIGRRPNADHLFAIFLTKVVKSVVARHAGHTGYEQRQGRS